MNNQDITAAEQQHHQRKHLLALGDATADEVLASKKRKIQVVVENSSRQPVGTAAILTLLNNLNNTLNDPKTGLAALNNTVNNLNDLKTGLAANTVNNLNNTHTGNDPNTGLQALNNTVNDLNDTISRPNTGLQR